MIYRFDTVPSKYWSEKVKIEYIQRRVIIACIMYYKLNVSCFSDKDFDEFSKQLVELQKNCNEDIVNQTCYYYALYDYDGSTGFHIYNRLNKSDREYLTNIATNILKAKGLI